MLVFILIYFFEFQLQQYNNAIVITKRINLNYKRTNEISISIDFTSFNGKEPFQLCAHKPIQSVKKDESIM